MFSYQGKELLLSCTSRIWKTATITNSYLSSSAWQNASIRTAFKYTKAAVIASSFAWHIDCRFYFQVSWTFSNEEEVLLIIVFPNLSMQSSNLSLHLSKDLMENDWHESSRFCKISWLFQNMLQTFLGVLSYAISVQWEQCILWWISPAVSLFLGLNPQKCILSE